MVVFPDSKDKVPDSFWSNLKCFSQETFQVNNYRDTLIFSNRHLLTFQGNKNHICLNREAWTGCQQHILEIRIPYTQDYAPITNLHDVSTKHLVLVILLVEHHGAMEK